MSAPAAGGRVSPARAPRNREQRNLLVAMLAAPAGWTVHLLLGYAAVSIGCSAGWHTAARVSVASLTVACALGAAGSGWIGFRERPRPLRPWAWMAHLEEDESTHAFLSGVGLLSTFVFVMAIVLGGVGSLLVPLCSTATHH